LSPLSFAAFEIGPQLFQELGLQGLKRPHGRGHIGGVGAGNVGIGEQILGASHEGGAGRSRHESPNLHQFGIGEHAGIGAGHGGEYRRTAIGHHPVADGTHAVDEAVEDAERVVVKFSSGYRHGCGARLRHQRVVRAGHHRVARLGRKGDLDDFGRNRKAARIERDDRNGRSVLRRQARAGGTECEQGRGAK
jgi:hypothetical protein